MRRLAHNAKGSVIKVSDINQAQIFYSVERAIYQKNKAPSKCAGFYYIDTSIDPIICQDNDTGKIKRKSFLLTIGKKYIEKQMVAAIYAENLLILIHLR